MGETIRVRVKDGVLEPLEQMNLPEGKEVVISVVTIVEDPDEEAFLRSAGSWKDLIDAEEFIRKVYEDRLLNSRENPQL
jgi:predicted DNA-binding antitoxin AbrB/MazE fold protein